MNNTETHRVRPSGRASGKVAKADMDLVFRDGLRTPAHRGLSRRALFRVVAVLAVMGAIPGAWPTAMAGAATVPVATAGGFRQPDPSGAPDLFVWTDTCNVYVLREGDSALLIDLGDGSVLDRLGEIGVKRVEWVLFTHHHREQCQGYPRLREWNAKVGAPAAERALFERPSEFRKMDVRLKDAFTIHGASFVRPPLQPIPIDRAFKSGESFTWRGREIQCVDTRGNSPGAMSYLLRRETGWLAFTGDLMLEGGRLHTWFDSEWDYGLGAGVWALANSAAEVAGYDPAWLLPSHGAPVRQPRAQLMEFQEKLVRFERVYVRGYTNRTFGGPPMRDKISRPTKVPQMWQISPHVFKLRSRDSSPNFYLILADSGRALAVDCGLVQPEVLDAALEGMKREFGLKQIEGVFITHMHGDHFLQAPHLREKWGAGIWAIERMAPVCENPEWFDYAAPIQAYGRGVDRVRFDRLFKSGEVLEWEGYRFTIDWMPGQTEFALCVTGEIDGRRVAFTGDNIFADPDDPRQNGHEAVVAHNSAVLEEGYIQGAEYLHRLQPDIILGGHGWVMDQPAKLIERYRAWSYQMREAFRELSPEDDYRYWFDPYWVRAEPYRSRVSPGESFDVSVFVRNFGRDPEAHRIEIHPPPGWAAAPGVLDGSVPGEARRSYPVRIRAAADAKPGVQIIAFDITRGGKRYGQWFDFIVEVQP